VQERTLRVRSLEAMLVAQMLSDKRGPRCVTASWNRATIASGSRRLKASMIASACRRASS